MIDNSKHENPSITYSILISHWSLKTDTLSRYQRIRFHYDVNAIAYVTFLLNRNSIREPTIVRSCNRMKLRNGVFI
ncbi:hypothetical protein OUZ56_026675 [Daphnia magna]|uniref:Uncharacterized protein n=1 Tax=Daphnia magna TaxID=35525 RepID=A0ABQ9ZMF7_9CRUS|nr:hypothetical protein OUZ56_026675 [Daphnia magna]